MGWLSGWGYRQIITVTAGMSDGNLSNHPCLLLATDSDLATNARADGYDFRVTQADGQTLCDIERVSWDSGTGDLHLWFEANSISSSSTTTFYLYYGNPSASDAHNPSAVWAALFRNVYHLEGDPSGTAPQFVDSCGNQNGTAYQSSNLSSVNGKLGNGISFNQGCIQCESSSPVQGDSSLTVYGWCNRDASQDFLDYVASLENPWLLRTANDGGQYELYIRADGWEGVSYSNLSSGWEHIVGRYDKPGAELALFYNGTKTTASASGNNLVTKNDAWAIGAQYYDGDRWWIGELDEVWLTDQVHSDDRIIAFYRNTDDPGTYVYLGSEEEETGGDRVPRSGATLSPYII